MNFAELRALIGAELALLDKDFLDRMAATDDVEAAMTRAPASNDLEIVGDGIAVIPVRGIILPAVPSAYEEKGIATSTIRLVSSLQAAAADESVKGVLMPYHTPGGSVRALAEASDALAALAAVKPVVAHVELIAASAGYWLASQSSYINAQSWADVGSIGVYVVHQEDSEAQSKEGIKTTIISAGARKVEGNRHEPLTDAARARIQETVDRTYDAFVAAVARGRGVEESVVRGKSFGEGATVPAPEALTAGMVDSVGSIVASLARLETTNPGPKQTALARMTRERALALLKLRST